MKGAACNFIHRRSRIVQVHLSNEPDNIIVLSATDDVEFYERYVCVCVCPHTQLGIA
jgi:hypothetical protein